MASATMGRSCRSITRSRTGFTFATRCGPHREDRVTAKTNSQNQIASPSTSCQPGMTSGSHNVFDKVSSEQFNRRTAPKVWRWRHEPEPSQPRMLCHRQYVGHSKNGSAINELSQREDVSAKPPAQGNNLVAPLPAVQCRSWYLQVCFEIGWPGNRTCPVLDPSRVNCRPSRLDHIRIRVSGRAWQSLTGVLVPYPSRPFGCRPNGFYLAF